MPDWTRSMEQTYEFCKVDPISWTDDEKLTEVTGCSISLDGSTETLGSSSIDTTELLDEQYIRTYLVTKQDGKTEKTALGTFLYQVPDTSYDGKKSTSTLDGYTPLIELKEKQPPIGFALLKNENIMEQVNKIMYQYMRGPIVDITSNKKLEANFISDPSDTWLTYIRALLSNTEYKLDIDAYGRTLFTPNTSLDKMTPRWTYSDDNSSILLPTIKAKRDLYGVPNVVEVIYSNGLRKPLYAKVKNTNENSPVSIINRGREIVHRDYNSAFSAVPTQAFINEYANNLLENMSRMEYTVTYSHGYCPVRVGDCVLLNYEAAGFHNIKAKVISQNIKCGTGCIVEETAVFVNDLWKGK